MTVRNNCSKSKIIKILLRSILIPILFFSCSDITAPLAPEDSENSRNQISEDDLTFISVPQSIDGLNKIVSSSRLIKADQGGVVNLEVGNDFEYLDLSAIAPFQITTWDLSQQLIEASPLSPTVLMALCNNPALKNDYWIKMIFEMNSPLRECVLLEILDKKMFTNSWDLMMLLVANSPLPQQVLDQIDTIGLARYEQELIRYAQRSDRQDENEYNKSDGSIKVSLNVLPNSILQDTEIAINCDDQNLIGSVDLVFSPHGIVFFPRAILNIEACGLDFSNIDISKINIFYDNQNAGYWEPMDRSDIIIRPEQGYIRVVDAKLPHFSRYAVAYSN